VGTPRQAYFVLRETPCPYLDGRFERKLVTELPAGDTRLYSELSRAGFRRSHRFAYRPACTACEACKPVRVPVADFRPSKSQKRIARRNLDLSLHPRSARADSEQYELFVAYLQARHGDGEMAGMAYSDYRAMIEDTVLPSEVVELRDARNRLRAACLVDWLDDGPSAVYSFFDPSEPDRSLGTEIILRLIAETKRRGLPHVYLGYWISESPKMAYKARFRPLEGLTRDGWRRLD
jgi:arginine-tRNA-protein transferase